MATLIQFGQEVLSDKKSTSVCCFILGSSMISWLSGKQTSVALSTTEDKYIATCLACIKAVWIHKLLTGLFDIEMDATDIYCDNQSCIKLTKSSMFHDKSKHIEIKYHYIQDMVQRRSIKLQYVPTEEQLSDVLTKPLSCVKFDYFRDEFDVARKDLPGERQ